MIRLLYFGQKGESSQYYNLSANQRHVLSRNASKKIDATYFNQKAADLHHATLPYIHKENNINEFNRERLLTQMNSNEGPSIAVSDVDNDGRQDVFIGGGKAQKSILLRANSLGGYTPTDTPWQDHGSSEVVEAIFFDSDSDGDEDLYIGHGDRVFSIYSPELHDVLYVNDGKGNFRIEEQAFRFIRPMSTGAVTIGDYNGDGLKDVFVGERYRNDYYGLPGSGYLYSNLGDNRFELDTIISNELAELGMITDAVWVDIDQDDIEELIICGEWMPITIVRIKNGEAVIERIEESVGIWHDMERVDIDADGDLDIVIGNVGTNAHFDQHMKMYIGDMDGNGSVDQIITRQVRWCRLSDPRYG